MTGFKVTSSLVCHRHLESDAQVALIHTVRKDLSAQSYAVNPGYCHQAS